MENNRPIEKLLRAYAKKRRDASESVQLHPATRRRLREEVSRQFPAAAAGESIFSRAFGLLRLHWVYAAAATVVVVLGSALLWPSLFNERRWSAPPAEMELARNVQSASPANPVPLGKLQSKPESPQPSAAPAPASSPEVAFAGSGANRKLPGRDAMALDQALRPPASPSAPPVLSAGDSGVLSNSVQLSDALQASAANAYKEVESTSAPSQTPLLAVDGGRISNARVAKDVERTGGGSAKSLADDSGGAPPVANSDQSAAAVGKLADSPAAGNLAFTSNGAPGARNKLAFGLTTTGPASAVNAPAANRELAGSAIRRFVRFDADQRAKESAKTDSARRMSVLGAFQVEQSGNLVRVIDADGSIYTGAVVSAEEPFDRIQADSVKTSAGPRSSSGGGGIGGIGGGGGGGFGGAGASGPNVAASGALRTRNPQPSYNYRVSGTNRTLLQPVEFSWNYVPATNFATGVRRAYFQNAAASSALKQSEAAPGEGSQSSNLNVSGQMRLGGGAATPLEAAPAAP